jgi:hypothetical protein
MLVKQLADKVNAAGDTPADRLATVENPGALHHHLHTLPSPHIFSPLLQRRKPKGHGRQGKAAHQGGQHSTKEAHHSRVSFLSICFLLLFAISQFPSLCPFSLDLLLEEIFGTEEVPEYILSDSFEEEEDAMPEQRVNHQLRRRTRHLEHDLRDIPARCNAELERRMSLEALLGGKITIFI